MDSDITQIMREIWETFLHLSISSVPSAGSWDSSDSVIGYGIEITGSQHWSVELICGQEAAKLAASAMFCKPSVELDADDVRETTSELVNMLGGNIKTLLPGKNQLSLPAAIDLTNSARQGAVEIVAKIGFICQGSPIEVCLYRHEEATWVP